MVRNKNVQKMIIAALLCAIGIAIPMFFPKIVIPPASFTLASHVPIYIAMFISPVVAIAVSLGTTVGFFFSTPLIIALRAFTHIIWALLGAYILKKSPEILKNVKKSAFFGLGLSLIHGLGEVLVVTWFYFGGMASEGFYQKGFLTSVMLLVGLGTVVHSMVDYSLSIMVWKTVNKAVRIPSSAKV